MCCVLLLNANRIKTIIITFWLLKDSLNYRKFELKLTYLLLFLRTIFLHSFKRISALT